MRRRERCLVLSHLVSWCLGVGQRTEHVRYSLFKEFGRASTPGRRGTAGKSDAWARDPGEPGDCVHTPSTIQGGCSVIAALKTLHGRQAFAGSG